MQKNSIAPEQKGAEICKKILSQLRSLLRSSIAGSDQIFLQIFLGAFCSSRVKALQKGDIK
ncbi:MAG: hypothetical protein K2X94_01790 [Amoebophilaceae bacterium]|nr:hypothetical protein [Amoebophilaceae bacterium]